ncbi:MAG: GNAT family N-acetyltransferase [Lachnospiraceae bacterium]|nr:GNAT family N-acetyltransferase [Lachnospiraceae bacterium]MBQ7602286.1 GNAT family N-acetyltransferase [Lachnospiraceae bacterium]
MELLRYQSFPSEYEDQIHRLLWACDRDFYPPLSTRGSTTEQNLRSGEESLSGPELYLNSLRSQSWLLAVSEGRLLGFMSFIPEKVVDGIRCVYFSTLIVDPEARHQGVARHIYRALIEDHAGKTIVLRTWSTNRGHLALLEQLGFRSYKVLKDDRGEGVDTIYFRHDPLTSAP